MKLVILSIAVKQEKGSLRGFSYRSIAAFITRQ
jgi:hypothetical protein